MIFRRVPFSSLLFISVYHTVGHNYEIFAHKKFYLNDFSNYIFRLQNLCCLILCFISQQNKRIGRQKEITSWLEDKQINYREVVNRLGLEDPSNRAAFSHLHRAYCLMKTIKIQITLLISFSKSACVKLIYRYSWNTGFIAI